MTIAYLGAVFWGLLQNKNLMTAAAFTVSKSIGTNPTSVLWMLPLAGSIAVVYKATKLRKIEAASFAKEVVILFGSIVVFIVVAALVLHALAWLITE
ncbi:MAG: hypothetical protein ACYTEQ_00085 [Planctomycetota bacterium]|jgi:hypothetical protein